MNKLTIVYKYLFEEPQFYFTRKHHVYCTFVNRGEMYVGYDRAVRTCRGRLCDVCSDSSRKTRVKLLTNDLRSLWKGFAEYGEYVENPRLNVHADMFRVKTVSMSSYTWSSNYGLGVSKLPFLIVVLNIGLRLPKDYLSNHEALDKVKSLFAISL